MAINAINGITVSTSSTINGISGVDEVNGIALDGGGGGGGFTPIPSGMVFYFVASTLGLADNAAVATATDISGAGNNHTQGTAGSRPTYKTAIVNGKAIIRGDGGDVLVHSGQVTTADSAFSMMAVVKKGATNSTLFYYNGDAGGNGWGLGIDGSGNRGVLLGGVAFAVGGAMSSDFEVWTVIRAGGVTSMWVNGVNEIISNPSSSPNTPSGDSFLMAASANNWDGDVAEVGVVDNDIGETVREAYEDYAGAEYDIVITH